jgi:hypothetical protein
MAVQNTALGFHGLPPIPNMIPDGMEKTVVSRFYKIDRKKLVKDLTGLGDL